MSGTHKRLIDWVFTVMHFPALALAAVLVAGCQGEAETTNDADAQEQAIERHRSNAEREAAEAGSGR